MDKRSYKAAACMLKDIIDEYNKANSDLSSSLDENTDPWGIEKLNEQMNVLKQRIENSKKLQEQLLILYIEMFDLKVP